MKHNYTAILFILLTSALRHAQAQEQCNFGARTAGMGYPSVEVADVWPVANKTEVLANLTAPDLAMYAANRFGERAFTTVALQAAYPAQEYGTYGLSRFGDELFSQQHAGLGVAHKLGQFSLGARADVWQVAHAGVWRPRGSGLLGRGAGWDRV